MQINFYCHSVFQLFSLVVIHRSDGRIIRTSTHRRRNLGDQKNNVDLSIPLESNVHDIKSLQNLKFSEWARTKAALIVPMIRTRPRLLPIDLPL